MTATSENGSPDQSIRLQGVRVHNLKNVDLEIPHGQLLCLSGLSGSGKTSLALDTLFAEGQRRYVECFSAYTRQFLDQWDKPDAVAIDGIPPAIAVTASRRPGTARTTVGTVTETVEYLRLLFARIAELQCPECGRTIVRYSPQSIAAELANLPPGQRYQIAFPIEYEAGTVLSSLLDDLRQRGFHRVLRDGLSIDSLGSGSDSRTADQAGELLVIVDRLKSGEDLDGRLADSLETAWAAGQQQVVVLREVTNSGGDPQRIDFSGRLACAGCGLSWTRPEAVDFSFNSPRGACPECEGFGSVSFPDIQRIVPDPTVTVRDGAIAPWNSPAYRHELDELMAIADVHDFPLDVPFADLQPQHLRLVWEGDRSRDFGGLNGFFAWLEKRRYKSHLRIFMARWRSYRECSACGGDRLNPQALAWKLNGRSIAGYSGMPVSQLLPELRRMQQAMAPSGADLLRQLTERLEYLERIGVGYLSLNRTIRSLGGGERQRVALTRALGTTLVRLLYVLDEPSSGLHPADIGRLIPAIVDLQRRGNTVVMVEHNPVVTAIADRIVELGPEAGTRGGEIVFDGPWTALQSAETQTGRFCSGQSGFLVSRQDRQPRGRIRLSGATGNNLKNLDVEFPLGMLVLVTGVSGSGKSTLVRDTLAPAVQQHLGMAAARPLDFQRLAGAGQVDEIAVIDQQPLSRLSRSNPATYVKAFAEIRQLFASTADAKARGLKPGDFSFNVAGGRCENCQGEGWLVIDMQFMADVLKVCDQCRGRRFGPEVLAVRYRDRSIADVLDMTVDEAFGFFRGHRRIQSRLKLLKDAGLNYVPLGQTVRTLSSGEAQRLKLASWLGSSSSKQTLFVMDEPTAGLHLADVSRLIESFHALIDVGHSLVVVEHNLLMMARADYIIDLGPGPADQGGRLVASGTPEEIAACSDSVTGRYLRQVLKGEGLNIDLECQNA